MKIPAGDTFFDQKRFARDAFHAKDRLRRYLKLTGARKARRSLGTCMRTLSIVLMIVVFPVIRTGAQSAQQWKLPDIPWAFPVRDKVQPVIDERVGPQHVPGSSKAYTQDQIDNFVDVPDWYPEEHAPMPQVVSHGAPGGVLGCASCHLASGLGHPESANLAGVPAAYIIRQLGDFKAGNRMGEAMNDMAKNITDEDARQASEWFAALKPKIWQKVVETDRVPKTFINEHLMRMPLPGGDEEPV